MSLDAMDNIFNNMANNENTLRSSIINDSQPCRVIHKELITCGQRLSLSKITFVDQLGCQRMWEGAMRLKSDEKKDIVDTVSVIAFHKRRLHYDCIILMKEYRPSLQAYTIEMPTGLVKESESPVETALRALKENTGFAGRVKTIGPVLAVDPYSNNCSMQFATLQVDGDDPENRFLQAKNSNESTKETLLIPISELMEKLGEFAASSYLIDSRIDAFAIGLVMGNRSRKPKIPPCFA